MLCALSNPEDWTLHYIITYSLVRWFVGSLVRWFVGSLVRWFVGSLVRWFVGSLVRWFVGSLVIVVMCSVVGNSCYYANMQCLTILV